MKVNLFCNRQNPNDLKFFIAPASLLEWIKSIPANGDKWEQEIETDLKNELIMLGFKKVEPINVSFFNYENEILKYLQELAPNNFETMSSAWLFAEKQGHKIINTVAFVEK